MTRPPLREISAEHRALAANLASLPARLAPVIPDTAPKDPTRVYAQLTVAWALARLGFDEPAAEALATAERVLPSKDRIHQALLALYRSSIELAQAGLPPWTLPPKTAVQAVAELERFEQYKIQRIEASLVSLPKTSVGTAFYTFIRDEIPLARPHEDVWSEVRRQLDEATGSPERALGFVPWLDDAHASAALEAILQRALALQAEDGVPLMIEAARQAEQRGANVLRPEVLASLQAGLVELASPLYPDGRELTDDLEDFLKRQDIEPRPAHENTPEARARQRTAYIVWHQTQKWRGTVGMVWDLARPLSRCGQPGEVAALVEAVRAFVPEEALPYRFLLTAAEVRGSDPERIAPVIERGQQLFAAPRTTPQQITVLAALADLATQLPLERAIDAWASLVPHAGLPDNYSTSTHFGLSFLQAVERLAEGHVRWVEEHAAR